MNIMSIMNLSLQVGDEAPPFSIVDTNGKHVQLSDFKGKKVVLTLYRVSACPLCNLQVAMMKRRFQQFQEAGVHILSVFESTPDELAKYAGKQATENFPIYCPSEGKPPDFPMYAAYQRPRGVMGSVYGVGPCYHLCVDCKFPSAFCKFGANPSFGCPLMTPTGFWQLCGGKRVFSMPTDVLIGEDGKIVRIFHGSYIGQHIDMHEVDAFAGISSKPSEQAQLMSR